MSDETASFEDCEAIADTGKGLLIRFANRDQPVWIPQSQIHADSEVYRLGDTGSLVIAEWLALEKGLI